MQIDIHQDRLTENRKYQDLRERVKALIKMDAHTKFYHETKPFYIEAGVSGVGFGTELLQVRDVMNCT